MSEENIIEDAHSGDSANENDSIETGAESNVTPDKQPDQGWLRGKTAKIIGLATAINASGMDAEAGPKRYDPPAGTRRVGGERLNPLKDRANVKGKGKIVRPGTPEYREYLQEMGRRARSITEFLAGKGETPFAKGLSREIIADAVSMGNKDSLEKLLERKHPWWIARLEQEIPADTALMFGADSSGQLAIAGSERAIPAETWVLTNAPENPGKYNQPDNGVLIDPAHPEQGYMVISMILSEPGREPCFNVYVYEYSPTGKVVRGVERSRLKITECHKVLVRTGYMRVPNPQQMQRQMGGGFNIPAFFNQITQGGPISNFQGGGGNVNVNINQPPSMPAPGYGRAIVRPPQGGPVPGFTPPPGAGGPNPGFTPQPGAGGPNPGFTGFGGNSIPGWTPPGGPIPGR